MPYIPFERTVAALRTFDQTIDIVAVLNITMPIASDMHLDAADVFSMAYLLICAGTPLSGLDNLLRTAIERAV